jgi:hypothetical protein
MPLHPLRARRTGPVPAFLSILAAALALCAPAGAQDSGSKAAFIEKMQQVSGEIAKDPGYDRIPLETAEEGQWFTDLAYRYWSKQISREQFIEQGVAKYPDNRRSFETLAAKLAP